MPFQTDIQAVAFTEGSSTKQNKFIKSVSPAFALFSYENSTPDLQLQIAEGTNVIIGGKAFNYAGGLSPTFTPPMAGTEVHLLYAYNLGGVLTFAIKTSGFTAGDPETYDVEFPISEVTISNTTTQLFNADIIDVRNSGQTGGGSGTVYGTVQVGTLGVMNQIGFPDILHIREDFIVNKAQAHVRIAPTGATLEIDVEYSTDQGATWIPLFSSGTLDITASSYDGEKTTNIIGTPIVKNSWIRFNILQVGSTVAGGDLTVTLS